MRDEVSRFAGWAVAARTRVTLFLLVAIGLVAWDLPAEAAEFHPYKFSIDGSGTSAGQFGAVASVAVEQTSGTVYVFDRAKAVIDKFDSAGNPQEFSATGTSSLNVLSACPGFAINSSRLRTDIAVDSSGGPNHGNIYIASYLGGGVCAFDSTGTLIYHMPGVEPLDGACGVATDALGRLWVGTFAEPGALQYTAAGAPPTLVTIVSTLNLCRLAVGSAGNIYLANWFGIGVERWTVSGFQETIRSTGYEVDVDPATDLVYVADKDRVVSYTPSATKIAEIGVGIPYALTGEGKLIDALGVAVRGATGEVYVADGSAGRVNVYRPLGTFPDVTTGDSEDVRRVSAQITGTVSPAGGDVTDCYVEWGMSTAYGNVADCSQPTPYDDPTEITADISGLEPGTTYHYRLVAENAEGPNWGSDRTFTTPYVNEVETGAATAVTRDSATLNGSLDPSGLETTFYFQWGPTQAYGNATPLPPGAAAGSGAGDQPVSAEVDGLQLGTTYHYRLVAVNEDGTTFGEDRTFETQGAVIGLETEAPTDVTQTAATLNGELDPDGLATHYYFEWGEDPGYGNVTHLPPGGEVSPAPGATQVSAEIEGLSSYATYHYRLVATNSLGTTYGGDQVVTTLPPLLPSITNTTSSGVTKTSATLAAEINPGFGHTVYRFQWGTDSEYGFRSNTSPSIGSDNSPHPVSLEVEGLLPGTTYHFRAVAINFSGVTYGPDRTFTTEAEPRPEPVVSAPAQTTPPPPPAVTPPARCQKGFVKRKGRCVRKPVRCRGRNVVKRKGRCVKRRPRKRGKRRRAHAPRRRP